MLKATKSEKILVHGFQLGAGTALKLATEMPDKVAGVVASNPFLEPNVSRGFIQKVLLAFSQGSFLDKLKLIFNRKALSELKS